GEINNYTWNYTWTVPEIHSDDVSVIVNAQGLGHKAWDIVDIEIDSKAPEIVNNTPEEGETITTDSYIEVKFDEPVNIEDLENNFTLYQGDNEIPGSVNGIDGMRTMRFLPDESFTRQLSYNYQLKGGVRDLSDPGNILNADMTVEFTTVEGPPEVTVEGPEMDVEYRIGNTTYINWTVGDGDLAQNPIDISYSLDGGESWITIKNNTSNSGSYLWKIPKKAMVNYPVDNVKVNVSCTNQDGFTGYGYSVPFTIFENRLPEVEIFRPYEGMQVVRGQKYTISWEAKDELELPRRPIVISLSTDGGASWKVIAQNVRNEGSYSWTVEGKTGNATLNVTCIDSNQDPGWAHSPVFKILRENPLNLSLNPDNESFYSRDFVNLTWDAPPLIEGEQRAVINFTGDGENWRIMEEITDDRNYSVIRLPFETSSDCKFKLTIYDSDGVLYKIDSKEFEVFPKIVDHDISYLGDYFMILIEFDGYVSLGRMERALTIYKDGEPMDISRDNIYQKTSSTLIYLSPRLPEGKYRVEFNSSDIGNRDFEDKTVFTFEEEGTEGKIVTYWPMLFLIPLALIMFYLYRGKGEKSTRKISSDMVEIER
ncbi:MAG: Ig-like domain-containing protein, partial [Thermoplasmatota archaeon]